MSDESGISEKAAREQIMRKALEGRRAAWKALVEDDRWAYLDGVLEAAKFDEDALASVLEDPWTYVILNRINGWAERRYHFIHDNEGKELPEVLSDTLRRKIKSLEND